MLTCMGQIATPPLMGRKNLYDGIEEYYVTVKERSQREEQHSQEEVHRKLSEATSTSRSISQKEVVHIKKDNYILYIEI